MIGAKLAVQEMIENVPALDAQRYAQHNPLAKRRWVRLARRSSYWLMLLAIVCIAGEVTARIDDWARLGVPIMHTPNRERDLVVSDHQGTRGKPNGRFKKWKLNRYGFRSPEITLEASSGTRRIMILGASETFGLYESPGKEFPAQLANILDEAGKTEIINAAMPGLTLQSMHAYWERYVKQFRPDIVIIYPSPLFYLGNVAAKQDAKASVSDLPRTNEVTSSLTISWSSSRFLVRLKDMVHIPDFVQSWRDQRTIDARVKDQDPNWIFQHMPQDRVDLFRAHLDSLTDAISSSGAKPFLVTHALRATDPHRAEEERLFHATRVHIPRATKEVMIQFEEETRLAVLQVAARKGLEVLDAAAVMNGNKEFFADLVHFNDEGARFLAEMLADRLR